MSLQLQKSEWQKKSRRSFLFASFTFLAGGLGFWFTQSLEQENGVPWPFRRVLTFNEKIWRALFKSKSELVDSSNDPASPPPGTPARLNSDIGIEEAQDLKDWKLEVFKEQQSVNSFTIEQLSLLPQVEHTEVFKCVEGWSQIISYKGIRFSEFLKLMKINAENFAFVALETPDKAYYVSVDMASMLHPKTVLATEMNGVKLSSEHGAPLRLIIPVKYGIKNLKRVGQIVFSQAKPPDYWEEQGYDWYAGL